MNEHDDRKPRAPLPDGSPLSNLFEEEVERENERNVEVEPEKESLHDGAPMTHLYGPDAEK